MGLLPDLIARPGGQGVDAYQPAALQSGGRLPGFEKGDKDEIRAWLSDLQRNRWTGSLAEYVEAVAVAGRRRPIENKASKGRTVPYEWPSGDCDRTS